MREILYIRLRGNDAAEPVEYCVTAPEATASFAVARAPLTEVLAQAGHRRIVALVPAAELRLTSVQIPARQAAKALKATPFALEDQLADDIDTLHFALGARLDDQRWPVAVVAQARMENWIALFAAHGVEPDALLPDLLALATPDDAHFTALVDQGEVLVRSGRDSGFVCELGDLEFCLTLADPQRGRRLRLAVPREQAFDLSTLDWPVEPLHGFGSGLEVLLQQLRRADAIDLLQGDYARRTDASRWFAPWRHAAAFAAGALLLAGLVHGIETYRLQTALAAQDAANVARYQQVFPDETRIVDLQAQLDQQFAALQGGGSGGQMLPLLGVLNEAIAEVPELNLQSLQFRDGMLYAGLGANSLDALEQLKTWFAQSRAATLSVESANSGTEGVQIRVRLSAT